MVRWWGDGGVRGVNFVFGGPVCGVLPHFATSFPGFFLASRDRSSVFSVSMFLILSPGVSVYSTIMSNFGLVTQDPARHGNSRG